jgi:site-specific DNA-methyltransferase (adenine-specific)
MTDNNEQRIKIIQGNCVDKIKELEDNSIDCVVSSPPYFGLRDYGNDEQFGLEKNYKDYLSNTVKVFETFKPKLKDTATIWWNVGDSYHRTGSDQPVQKGLLNNENINKRYGWDKKHKEKNKDFKPKDLMMIPNRVAIALQDAGWYIRSEIIWHKPNPMPESVTDRPTSCHEKIWLITKNKKYYYDYKSIKEPAKDWGTRERKKGSAFVDGTPGRSKQSGGKNCNFAIEGKNKRNVWTVTTKPCREAHFATFPKDLIEPCIKAGCPENGTVLDPFGGSGTTAIVAALNNRNAILIELNQDYINIANKRIDKELGLFKQTNKGEQ